MSFSVVGADYPNKDGSSRHEELDLCQPGEAVELVHEPDNDVDPRAVAVFSERGVQIGYIRAERAQLVLAELGRGPVTAIFQQRELTCAIIRAGFRGALPILPQPPTQSDVPPEIEVEWWPDEPGPDYD